MKAVVSCKNTDDVIDQNVPSRCQTNKIEKAIAARGCLARVKIAIGICNDSAAS